MHQNALLTHRRALKLRRSTFGEHSEPVAASLQNIGNCLFGLGLVKEAEAYYLQSLGIKRRVWGERHEKVMAAHHNLANLYMETGRMQLAEASATMALQIAHTAFGSTSPKLIDPLVALGAIQSASGRDEEAMHTLQQALVLQLDSVGEQHPDFARLLHQTGLCRFRTGFYTEALIYLQQAAALITTFPDTDPAVASDFILNEGACLYRLGDYRAAADRYRLALGYAAQPAQRATALYNLSVVLREQGEVAEALQAIQEANNLLILETSIEADVQRRLQAHLLLQLGACYHDWGRPDIASVFYQKAFNAYATLNQTQAWQARTLNRDGLAHLHLGDHRGAVALFNRARQYAEAAGEPLVALIAQCNAAESAIQIQQVKESLAILHQAEQAVRDQHLGATYPYEALQVMALLTRAHLLYARTSSARSDWQKTFLYARTTAERMADLRTHYRSEESGWALQHALYDVFNTAAEATLALGSPEDALQWTERGKAEGLRRLDHSALWPMRNGQGGSEDMIRQQDRHMAWVTARKRVYDLQATLLPGENAPKLDTLKRALAAIEESPEFQQHRRSSDDYLDKPLSAALLRKRLQPNQTLLAYALVEGSMLVFVIDPDTLRVHQLQPGEDFQDRVSAFSSLCSINPEWLSDSAREQAKQQLVDLGYDLYKRILEPLRIPAGRHLLLAPDAGLNTLPFEALLTEPATQPAFRFRSHPYLVRRHAVTYLHSIGHWLHLRARSKAKTPNQVLTMAPNFFNHPAGLTPLTHNRREAEAVKASLGGDLVTGDEATKAYFLEHAHHYRYLFMATHGYMEHRNPEYSFIAFSSTTDSADASLLYQVELAMLPLDADLVTLSACQTAAGQVYRGEGLISLVHACHQAGARAVMASLWNVDDQQTPLLILGFFEHLRTGKSKGEALRAAQEHYVRNEASHDKAHPFFWAGFITTGDDRPLDQLPGRYWALWEWVVVGLAVLLFLGSVWFVLRYRRRFNRWPRLR